MSDRMTPIPFESLLNWILTELPNGSVFGVRRPFMAAQGKKLKLFNEKLEVPFGPAAGPHTQLAQNIIAAYYAGARFFELKTVQTLDGEDLPVEKPCILAADECYNVEWSTELTVSQALEEYIKAWFIIKLIAREFQLGDPDGFMFNMSVGYSYEGITSEKIDGFIEGLKDASMTPIWAKLMDCARDNLLRFSRIDESYLASINPHVCTSATLSTLHGCPPTEIERIAAHLIEKKKLNTFVKCNPTLLGYRYCRDTLDALGFDHVSFDEYHFNDDLQFADAVPMFKRLEKLACDNGLAFGLKLSNTFPVQILRGELPGKEMYMSGRSLYPLTIEMACRISEEFDGQLRLSFSGGADAFNISALYGAGIWPITLATTLLKPGGYQRLTQMAEQFQKRAYRDFAGVSVGKVEYLAESARSDPRGKKHIKRLPSRKLSKKVPLVNCFTAPCTHGCPIGQDIPRYIELVGRSEYEKALALIVEKNPLPTITGTICPHRCAEKCTRSFLDESIRIRSAKLTAARCGYDAFMKNLAAPKAGKTRVAVVGGGPAGMAAAFFLARQGANVSLYEKRGLLGGVVRYIIPDFRITSDAIDRDAALIEKMGVKLLLNTEAPTLDALKKNFDAVVYATGAWVHGGVALKNGCSIPVLEFLEAFSAGRAPDLGTDVVVVGGGNTAMDAARAAVRTKGVMRCRLVYRRTKQFMPADEEELNFAIADGVEFYELLAPVSLNNGVLTCDKMQLGAPDASGRRSPAPTGETVTVPCTALIAAVGERVDAAFFEKEGLTLNARGQVQVDPTTFESSVPNVYVIGDAAKGPATVVEAIANARRAADAIVGPYETTVPAEAAGCEASCYEKQAVLKPFASTRTENDRCLDCGTICECCVTVCPNRANVAVSVPGARMPQIVHVDKMCNECGNCLVFCPYDSAPYKDKLTLFSTKADFDASDNAGFLYRSPGSFTVRLDGTVREITLGTNAIDPAIEEIIAAVERDYSYLLKI